jgi:hypothetical protein
MTPINARNSQFRRHAEPERPMPPLKSRATSR